MVTPDILTMLTAQTYDQLGRFSHPVSVSLKILLSRCCELMNIQNIKTPVSSKDPELAMLINNFIKILLKFDDIMETPRAVCPKVHEIFHSRLTLEDMDKLERIQQCCLRINLGENYVSYAAALEMTGLKTLFQRREDRCLAFGLKATKHPLNCRMVFF